MKFTRIEEVKQRTGLSRGAFYSRIKGGTFPKHIPLDGRSVGRLDTDVYGGMANQIVKSRNQVANQEVL